MGLLDYGDVILVVRAMIEDGSYKDHIEKDDVYQIEKLADRIFDKVRKEQLEQRHSLTDGVADTHK